MSHLTFKDSVQEIIMKTDAYKDAPAQMEKVLEWCDTLASDEMLQANSDALMQTFYDGLLEIIPAADLSKRVNGSFPHKDADFFNQEDHKASIASAAFMVTLNKFCKTPAF
jgi:hypothetical protein